MAEERAGRQTEQGRIGAAALAGIVAGAVGLAVSELVAGLLPGVPSLVVSIGSLVVALQPPGAKELVASLFGTADKIALNLAVIAVALAIAAGAGVVGQKRFLAAVAIFAACGGLGAVAAVAVDEATPLPAALGATVSVAAAAACLRWLLVTAGRRPASQRTPTGGPGPVPGEGAPTDAGAADPGGASATPPPAWDRRRFLQASGITIAVAALAGGLGRVLLASRPGAAVPPDTALPSPAAPVPTVGPGTSLPVSGITPLVTPSGEFFQIDTALISPNVDLATWRLRVTGMVERELAFGYDDLRAMPLVEQWATLACVSNDVGGDLVGNASWTGVPLKSLLEAAGVLPGATQIVGRAVDGFTAGFPTAWALEPSREPLVALGMNGSILPVEHGFPARLIVPGLFGYVSATKWLAEIELTTLEAFDGYWVPLGWAKEAPILTQSRIDVPRDGGQVPAGPVDVAGVAWAPDRGVSRVEVRVDEGPWLAAELSRPVSAASWLQWRLPWEAPPGEHAIEVRATDGLGMVQTEERTRPAPDGARGHHRISVRVG
jgi:DMSO/TMAO reductase YedYZ molybdopterin-dependent catalytic subunit